MYDCAILCTFATNPLGEELLACAVSGVVAGQVDAGEFRLVAERVLNLERAFNVREGFGRADETVYLIDWSVSLCHKGQIRGARCR